MTAKKIGNVKSAGMSSVKIVKNLCRRVTLAIGLAVKRA